MNYEKLVKTAGRAAGTIAGAAACEAVISDNFIQITKYVLKTEDYDRRVEPVIAAAVSDLHFSRFGKDGRLLVNKIKSVNPDVIFIMGDFFDYKNFSGKTFLSSDYSKVVLENISKIAPSYFSVGNHDIRWEEASGENLRQTVEHAGIRFLNYEYDDVKIKGRDFRIGGFFDYGVFEEDYYNRWIGSEARKFLLDFENTDAAKLLLAHRPNTFIYTKYDNRNTDAVFCGHYHGGLWRIPIIDKGIFAPELGFFPEYSKGEYNFGDMTMFLNSGLEGYSFVPRMFNRPEVMKINII